LKQALKEMRIGKSIFAWGTRTYVMGILNITPDSFSGDGLFQGKQIVEAALKQGRGFLASGADMLDVGGESTRPGAEPVSAEQEMERVIPVIEALSREIDLPISIDTYKAGVAAAALDAGASLVNDVWGLRADPDLAPLVTERGAPVILMHNRSQPANAEVRERLGGRYVGVEYANLTEDVKKELLESVRLAHEAGILDDKIILDPGIGFGKTVEQNLELLNRCDEIRELGYPLLIGPSRKSFIGYTLDLPPEQRVEGTAAAVAVAILRGADIVRVHDVEQIQRVAKMTDAIVRRKAT
jgi:dihydropteroate synthase